MKLNAVTLLFCIGHRIWTLVATSLVMILENLKRDRNVSHDLCVQGVAESTLKRIDEMSVCSHTGLTTSITKRQALVSSAVKMCDGTTTALLQLQE